MLRNIIRRSRRRRRPKRPRRPSAQPPILYRRPVSSFCTTRHAIFATFPSTNWLRVGVSGPRKSVQRPIEIRSPSFKSTNRRPTPTTRCTRLIFRRAFLSTSLTALNKSSPVVERRRGWTTNVSRSLPGPADASSLTIG